MAQYQQAPTEHIHVVVTMDIRENKLEAFFKAVKPMVISTNQEKGCLRYNIHQDKKKPTKIVMVEEWDTQRNLTKHLKQEHVRKFNALQAKEQWARGTPSIFFCGGPVVKLK
eukprot:379986_1